MSVCLCVPTCAQEMRSIWSPGHLLDSSESHSSNTVSTEVGSHMLAQCPFSQELEIP